MRRLALTAIAFAIGPLAGCGATGVFGCTDDTQCDAAAGGVCAPPGYCAFPKPECPTGLAYGEHAAAGLSGSCVPAAEGSGDAGEEASATEGGGPSSGPGTATGDRPGDGTTLALDGSSSGSDATGAAATSSPGDSTTTTTDDPSGSSSAGTGTDDDGSSGGPSTAVILYLADAAECAFPELSPPAPDVCAMAAGPMALTVDGFEDTEMTEAVGYLRFDLDEQILGLRVVEVTLRLRSSLQPGSDGPNAGEVWAMGPWTPADLQLATPTPVGAAPLAGNAGAVAIDDEVTWTLPPAVAQPGSTLHLGILPVGTNGVDYLDETSAAPPTLEVEVTLP